MASYVFHCKWRSQEFKTTLGKYVPPGCDHSLRHYALNALVLKLTCRFSRTLKVKDLKEAIAAHWNLDVGSIKLLLCGASNALPSTRLCDLPRITSPTTVTVLSGSQTQAKINEIEKAKYDQEAAEIEKNLKAAAERSRTLLVAPSAPSPSPSSPSSSSLYDSSSIIARHGSLELEIPIFSGACLPSGKPPSEHSNQIILPTSVLKKLTEAEVAFPILMKVSRRMKNGKEISTHVLPVEYRDRIDACYAPSRVLKMLGAYQSTALGVDEHHPMAEGEETRKNERNTPVSLTAAPSASNTLASHLYTPLNHNGMDTSSSTDRIASQEGLSSNQSISTDLPSTSSAHPQDEGFLVRLETVKLKSAKMATLQPIEFEWTTRIREEQQRPLLENQLRHYSCLTLGDEIAIEHEGKEFHFEVVELSGDDGGDGNSSTFNDASSASTRMNTDDSPLEAVSLLGEVDLAVNILLPTSSPQHVKLDPSSSSTGSEGNRTEVNFSLLKGESRFFEFDVEDPNVSLLFEMQSQAGPLPSLFISNAPHKPYPTAFDHTWAFEGSVLKSDSEEEETHFSGLLASAAPVPTTQSESASKDAPNLAEISRRQRKRAQLGIERLIISNADPAFRTGRFFLGVYAEWADSSAKLSVLVGEGEKFLSPRLTSSGGILLSSSGGVGRSPGGPGLSSSSELSAPPPEGSVRCDHCLRFVPQASYGLHELQCKRRNYVCPQCKWVGPHSDVEKHNSIAHSLVKCECGFEAEAELAKLHRQFECHLRPFTCPFCRLSLRYGLRASHLSECGSRTSLCPHCNVRVRNFDLASHSASFHPQQTDLDPTTSSSAPE